jgi:hypothetical protein
MIFFTLIKILFLGAILQIALVLVLSLVGLGFAIYRPWFEIGEWLLPSRGPGGHAMGGIGGLLFCAIGFGVYAGLLGYALDRFVMSRLRDNSLD